MSCRLSGILKAGAIKEQDKPIWYDVYKAFPPKYEPAFARPAVRKEIKSIYYPEDIIRGYINYLLNLKWLNFKYLHTIIMIIAAENIPFSLNLSYFTKQKSSI